MTYNSVLSTNSSIHRIDENNWAVSIVRKGDHAMIAFETVGYVDDQLSDGLCLRWFDLLPKDAVGGLYDPCVGGYRNEGYAGFWAAIKNDVVDGHVRFCPRKRIDGNPNPLNGKAAKSIQDLNRSELLDTMGWHENDVDTFIGIKDDIIRIINSAIADFNNNHRDSCVKFNLKGRPNYNCITWCWKLLKEAGINAENDRFDNKIAVQPIKNIGAGKNKGCPIL